MASILVVGGGLAGLVCAWKLRRAGHEVEVLEREARAGGSLLADVLDGFRLGASPLRIAPADPNLSALVDALGLARQAFSPRTAVLCDGRLLPVGLSRPASFLAGAPLSARGRAGLLAGVIATARAGAVWSPRHDAIDADAGLRRLAGDEATDRLLSPWLASVGDCEPRAISWGAGLAWIRRLRAVKHAFLAAGSGSLAAALVRDLPVRTGCDVTAVETGSEGARVRYRSREREHSAIADAAVLAVPAARVLALCPKLAPGERGFFGSVRTAAGIRVHLLLETAPALPVSGFGLPDSAGDRVRAVCFDHLAPGAAPPGAGSLRVAVRCADPVLAAAEADDALVERVLAELARTPLGRLRPLRALVRRDIASEAWAPGHDARRRRFLRRVDRSARLAFAGDLLVAPGAEGAVASGMRAAGSVVRSLQRERGGLSRAARAPSRSGVSGRVRASPLPPPARRAPVRACSGRASGSPRWCRTERSTGCRGTS